jgi:hypothetical protein
VRVARVAHLDEQGADTALRFEQRAEVYNKFASTPNKSCPGSRAYGMCH